MNWKRILAWSALIFVAAFGVGSALGTDTASKVGIFVSSSTLYFLFLKPIPKNRFRHAFAAFLLVEAMDWIVPLLLGAPLSYVLGYWDSSARHMGAALLGFAVASLTAVRRVSDNA